ncbi:MAG: 1-(5-phosphoribosyl)-5-[(5-phosphoribosylamino)methylideneamino]imidazole-4-carboxamide isomerase [Candidatus Melainabacteria bacterium]|nr:1-(5-phosphoribosyl)-5-[(5-phosphoribosylamino)methylideneamino]imidazole-4-carboxamide isomerase [Candidatus Melainabacteria bacterium]
MKENSFNIIPAIDILNGKCVRLTQGKYNQVEEFSASPQEIAEKWIDSGAKRLHVVDLNGAKEGYPVNFKIISTLIKISGVEVQVGGGIRTHETIKDYIKEGASYLILGTKAFKDKDFLKEVVSLYGEKIIIGLDLKNSRVALSGWQETSDIGINDLTEYISGIKQIIYTDITKDGTLSGPNLKSLEEVAKSFKAQIIVSGGISKLEDILAILKMKKQKHSNISGIILGKSLYKETINLTSAIELAKKEIE